MHARAEPPNQAGGADSLLGFASELAALTHRSLGRALAIGTLA